MKVVLKKIAARLNNPSIKAIATVCLYIGAIFLSQHAFATDLTAGSDVDIKDTMSGSGRHWAYYIEGAVALGTAIKTRNVYAFTGVVAVALFINFVLFLVGS